MVLCSLRWRTKQRTRTHATLQQGIDGEKPTASPVFFFFLISHKAFFFNILYSPGLPKAPAGINPLEHEELPMSVQRLHQNVRPTLPAAPSPAAASTEQYRGIFSQVKALPMSFSIKADSAVSLNRACVDNKNVILRVLKGTALLSEVLYFIINRFNGRWWNSCFNFVTEIYTVLAVHIIARWLIIIALLSLSETANNSEKQHFLGFASFLSGLGQHPFLPTLLGVISAQHPLVMVMEELRHQDLLGYLWKCRQVEEKCPVWRLSLPFQWDHWFLRCSLTAD